MSNPFASFQPYRFSSFQRPESEAGFSPTGLVRDIVRETVRDVLGVTRIGAAIVGEPLAALGISVPVRWEDLESRDWKGAAMAAAMVVGGLAARGATAVPAISRIAAKGASGRALVTAGTETLAGLTFGLARPLEEDETRAKALFGDAITFGAFGAGFSLARSAVRATLGQLRAQSLEAEARRNMALTAQKIGEEQLAREALGVRLANPEDLNLTAGIRRLPNGKVAVTLYDGRRKAAETEIFPDFGKAAAWAMEEGYTEKVGLFRKRAIRGITITDQTTLDLLEQGDIEGLLRNIRLEEYAAVRDAARKMYQRGQILTWLEAEALTEQVNDLGVVTLSSATRRSIERVAKLPRDLPDAEVLRRGIEKGVVSIHNLKQGVETRSMLKELYYGNLVPNTATYTVGTIRDAFLTRILTPRTVAELNPEFAPIFESANNRQNTLRVNQQKVNQFLFDLRQTTTPELWKEAVDIIERNVGETVGESRALAIEAAQATGRPELASLVTSLVERLQRYNWRFVAEGRLGRISHPLVGEARRALKESFAVGPDDPLDVIFARASRSLEDEGRKVLSELLEDAGLAGYFPIVNVGKWRLEISGQFKGYHKSFEEAQAALASLRASGDSGAAIISPEGMTWDEEVLTLFDPKQYKKLVEAIKVTATALSDETINTRTAREVASALGAIPTPAAVSLKFMANLRKRKLGIRDFSEDPIDALSIYMRTAERTLAFNDFEREAARIMSAIDPAKSNLRRFIQQYVDDTLGRPRHSEILFDNLMSTLGWDVPPRLLQQISRKVRWLQTNWRLGGVTSGVVNLTQFAINTFPKLGGRWTLKGMEALVNPKKFKETVDLFHKYNHDLGAFVPLGKEGDVAVDSLKALVRDKRYAEIASRIWLSVFNTAEKFNRVGTAAGALARERAMNPGISMEQAVSRAYDVVVSTQFDYSATNIPEILRGPLGAMLGQFKSFIIREIEFLAKLRKQELVRFAAAVQGLGGLALLVNNPAADLVNFLSVTMLDRTPEEALRISTSSKDTTLEKFVFFGLPGVVNVDVSDMVGIGTLGDITRGILGPTGNDIKTLFEFARDASADVAAYGSISHTTLNTFVQKAVPSAVRRAMRGYEILKSGEVRNPYTAKLIYRPEERLEAALTTSLGFPLLDMQQQRAADAVIARVRERYVRARTGYAKEAALALIRGDRQAAEETIREANRGNLNLDMRAVSYWVRELQRPANKRRERRTPRDLRKHYAELFELGMSEEP